MAPSHWLFALALLGTGCGQQRGPTPPSKTTSVPLVDHCLRAAQPADVSFEIALASGKTRFQPGERIELELRFASSTPQTYRLDAGTYDRIGRLHSDEYQVSPAVPDPLAAVFETGPTGMGGLRSMPVLTAEPVAVKRTLNEYLRFDAPGTYQLCVTSGRLETDQGAVPVSSNTIAFTILPRDAAWAASTLSDAVRTAESRTDDERLRALETLRFLGTPAATRQLVRLFRRSDVNGHFRFGLVGTAHRELAIAQMEQALLAPDHPVTSDFVRTLALLEKARAFPAPLGAYPVGDSAAIEVWQRQMKERRQFEREVQLRRGKQLVQALGRKQGEALAASVASLLELAWSTTGDAPAWGAALRSKLVEVFADLSAETQGWLLEHQWERFAGSDLLPALRKVYAREPTSGGADPRWLVLRRIHELAPDEGRRLILEEIQAPRARLGVRSMEVLGALDDALLPSLDPALADKLEGGDHPTRLEAARLIARYATAGIAQRVEGAYQRLGTDSATDVHVALLAYLLRAAPPVGEKALRELFQGHPSRAYQLARVAALFPCDAIERVAIGLLASAEPEAVSAAAQLLGRYGSARAVQPLWRRFEAWHAAWKGRAGELKRHVARDNPHAGQLQIQSALWRAIANGQGWLTPPGDLERLIALCVTESEKEQAGYCLDRWKPRPVIGLQFLQSGALRATVAHYDHGYESLAPLQDKLRQFPAGTIFTLQVQPQDARAAPQVLAELKAFVAKHQLQLAP